MRTVSSTIPQKWNFQTHANFCTTIIFLLLKDDAGQANHRWCRDSDSSAILFVDRFDSCEDGKLKCSNWHAGIMARIRPEDGDGGGDKCVAASVFRMACATMIASWRWSSGSIHFFLRLSSQCPHLNSRRNEIAACPWDEEFWYFRTIFDLKPTSLTHEVGFSDRHLCATQKFFLQRKSLYQFNFE